MASFKKILLFMLGGVVFGDAVAMLVGPGYLSWDNTPRYAQKGQQMLGDCSAVVKGTAHDLIVYQLVGMLAGAALGMIAGLFILRAIGKGSPPPVSGSAHPG